MKAERTNYIISIILLFVSTRTSSLSSSNTVLFILTIVIFNIYNTKGYKFDKFLLHYSFFFLVLFTAYTVLYSSINPAFIVHNYLSGFIAYCVFRMLGINFLKYLINIIYVLTLISFPLFVIQQFNYELLHSVNGLLGKKLFPSLLDFGGDLDSNSFIYSMKNNARDRNSGFMWEPGAFAAMLGVALMFNLLQNKFKVERKSIVLAIGIITTISTMGYIVLLILGMFLVYKSNVNTKMISLIFVVPGVLYILSLDFMTNKIIEEYSKMDETREIAFSADISDRYERVSLGRMASLQLDFEDFLNNPYIGVGGEFEAKTQASYVKLNRTNGWGNYLVTFGVLGIVLFAYNSVKSFKIIFENYGFSEYYLGIIIVLTVTFSNHILTQPLFYGLQIFHFAALKNNSK